MQKSRRRFGTVTSVFLRRRRTGQSMRRGFEGELVRVGVMKGVWVRRNGQGGEGGTVRVCEGEFIWKEKLSGNIRPVWERRKGMWSCEEYERGEMFRVYMKREIVRNTVSMREEKLYVRGERKRNVQGMWRRYEGGEMVRVCEGGIRKEKCSGYVKGLWGRRNGQGMWRGYQEREMFRVCEGAMREEKW
jgi:hypothetical protein